MDCLVATVLSGTDHSVSAVSRGELFKAAALSTLLGIGAELGSSNNESEIAKAIRESADKSQEFSPSCRISRRPVVRFSHTDRHPCLEKDVYPIYNIWDIQGKSHVPLHSR